MSAAGRGSDRMENDSYPTPTWCTRRILEALPALTVLRATWLEPCAGEGAIVRELEKRISPGSYIDGGDIRQLPSCVPHTWTIGSFETHLASHDVVITNPPFSLATDLIDHFLPRCQWLILLLRSAFKLGAYRDNMPDEYKLPQRPEFVASLSCKERLDGKTGPGCGWSAKLPIEAARPKLCPACSSHGEAHPGRFVQVSTTDAAEYSWFVWTPERGRKFGRVCVLPDTSLEERKADRIGIDVAEAAENAAVKEQQA